MAAIRCPICRRVSPGTAVSCECGYSFAARDATGAQTSVEVARRASHRRILLGLGLVIGTPIAAMIVGLVLLAIGLGLVGAVTVWLAVVLEVAGVYYTITGIRDLRRARRMLRAAENASALPAARIVE